MLLYKVNHRLTPFPTPCLPFSLRIFGHAQSVDKGNEDIGEEDDFDEEADDKECSSVFANATEEESEKMAAAVRSEGPTNLAEKLKARDHALFYTMA